MEPLSALSVAAAVVQFVDWGSRVLSESRHRYKSASGETLEELEVSQLCADLSSLSQKIGETTTALLKNQHPDNQHLEIVPEITPHETTLIQVCQECQNIAVEISSAIRGSGVAAKQLVAAIFPDGSDEDAAEVQRRTEAAKVLSRRAEASKFLDCLVKTVRRSQANNLEGWKQKLASARERLMAVLLTALWARTSAATERPVSTTQSWHHDDLLSVLQRIEKKLANISPDKQPAQAADMELGLDPEHQAVFNSIWSPDWLGKQVIISPVDEDPPPTLFREHCYHIVNSLRFAKMLHREEDIPQAYKSTYRWVFNNPRRDALGAEMWSGFPAWLEDQSTDKIYWITGKPGAGKSTLMKYIVDHPKLETHLHRWSSKRPLLLGAFYFWIAGDVLQKSHEGLLRTLLHQILSQASSLIPMVCPRRWALLQLFGTSILRQLPEWKLPELTETLSAINSRAGKSFNLALLISNRPISPTFF
ncbi:hypothetical protein B0T21DRAFT_376227 [Apiosordaria backusii]|uniref:Nephrocystin 3-like N-terminal domain-containing protein n=1 Tax=Apiosordaria backusii TaxID=314023 RepID=A0AA40AAE9_9PEZI|nr:hypothetical protein B0T21DRAFT_376227 [Apiosordaria backusii]